MELMELMELAQNKNHRLHIKMDDMTSSVVGCYHHGICHVLKAADLK